MFHFRNLAEGQTVARKQHRQTIHEGGDSVIMKVDPEKSLYCGIFNPPGAAKAGKKTLEGQGKSGRRGTSSNRSAPSF